MASLVAMPMANVVVAYTSKRVHSHLAGIHTGYMGELGVHGRVWCTWVSLGLVGRLLGPGQGKRGMCLILTELEMAYKWWNFDP